MPPQGYGLLGCLGWNYIASRLGKTTICNFARRHPIATALLLLGGNFYIWPHLYLPLWRAAHPRKETTR